MVCVDLEKGVFQENNEIAREVADRNPYGEWIKDESRRLSDIGGGEYRNKTLMKAAECLKLQVGVLC